MKTKVENKTEGKRTCRKCLLYEMDQGDYFRNLYAYIDRLDPDIKAGEKLYRDRLRSAKNVSFCWTVCAGPAVVLWNFGRL